MKKQIIFYSQGLRYEVELGADKTVLIGATEKAQVYLSQQEMPIQLKVDGEEVFYQYGDEVGLLKNALNLGEVVFYLREGETKIYDLLDLSEIQIGSHKGALISLDTEIELLLQKTQNQWILTRMRGEFYRNNHLEQNDQQLISFGDELSLGAVTIKLYPDEIWIQGPAQVGKQLTLREPSRYAFYEEYPDYHRSPRIIYRGSEDKILINPPGQEPVKPSDELLKLIIPPLMMIGVTILITLIQPRGIYILATVGMSITTMIFSVRGFFKNRKKYKADKKERIDLYRLYLKDKAMELTRLEREQKEGMNYHFPTVLELTDLVESYNHRIYEKTPLHFDFLYYRLGLGKLPTSYELNYGQRERSGKKDALEEEGYALYSRHKKIPDMPIPANLSHGPVGYIGPRNLVLEQLQLLVMQIATFHSYHDVQFITILPEEEKEQWSWMRWLPHAKLQELNVRGFVYNQRTRDQVLNSLNQILKLRRSQKEETSHKESTLFHPHYVVLVTDEKLILDHVIMEFFTEDPTDLGCSLVFVEDVMSSLSENIQTVINIKDRNTGQLVMEEGVLKETDFRLDHFPVDYDKERIARTLAPLNHLQNLKSSIPDSVTFMEMYGAETFEDLQVSSRWEKNAPYKSLAVPIGLRGQGDLVQLNLHEKAHGPHGLIAGTTGSGKSETIQSYILSLAVNFHPHDVAFLLIDYKGGGMANLFKNLPHLLGTITNLDGAGIQRALASIRAELRKRQRLFGRFGVNHINGYTKLYKEGRLGIEGDFPTEPLPHLFLISDEFAELKQNEPEFMTELVSAARIGRSLGIHLILATQKPSGVVNDQIWSNSRFKLALKVAEKADSNEIIKTPDAASITQPGRAYLQVGNNEIYELFQSAWSGARYAPSEETKSEEIDNRIWIINELGQYELATTDLSYAEEEKVSITPNDDKTELDAVVEYIAQYAKSIELRMPTKPWLPPLENELISPILDTKWTDKKHHKAPFALMDIPSEQAQHVLEFDIVEFSHSLIYGSPGFGKSQTLQTIVMNFARLNRPDQMHFNLFDFGTNGLFPLKGLPHVADIVSLDEPEKLLKLLKTVQNEIQKRRDLLAEYGVTSIEQYEQKTGKSMPFILNVVDSYDTVRDHSLENSIEATFHQVLREGASLGIYLIVTVLRNTSMKISMRSNFATQLVLYLVDKDSKKDIIGFDALADQVIPGRGQIKLEEPTRFQVYLATEGNSNLEQLQNLENAIELMDKEWVGPRPEPIPMLANEITFEDFENDITVKEERQKLNIPIGYDKETTLVRSIEPMNYDFILLMDDTPSQTYSLERTILSAFAELSGKVNRVVVDTDGRFEGMSEYFDTRIEESSIGQFLNELLSIIQSGIRREQPMFVYLPDINLTGDKITLMDKEVNTLFTKASTVNIHLIFHGYQTEFCLFLKSYSPE